MPQVDFYILQSSNPQDRQLFTCRLTQTVYTQGHKVYIFADSGQSVAQLDDMLWTFNQGSFLPHGTYPGENSNDVPIFIGHGNDLHPSYDVLINLTDNIPAFYTEYNRIAEIIDSDESHRQLARNRFRSYRDQGCTVQSHNI